MSEIAKIHGDDIRDKKLMEAKEASGTSDITSQCKFLLEKGDTGEFMKVLETYIDEKIRSALGALLNNLDKGTGVKAVAGIDNNNDLGSVTLANLASVLSAELKVIVKNWDYGTDLSGFKSAFQFWYDNESREKTIFMGWIAAGWAGAYFGLRWNAFSGSFLYVDGPVLKVMCYYENGSITWNI